MSSIKAMRVNHGKRQIDMSLSVTDMSRLENDLYNATPKQAQAICQDLGCTVDKLYDRTDLVTYPPSQKSVRQREKEQEQDISKITLRVPAELASRFRALCAGHTQVEVFEIMVIKLEKDRRPRTRASGHAKNTTALL